MGLVPKVFKISFGTFSIATCLLCLGLLPGCAGKAGSIPPAMGCRDLCVRVTQHLSDVLEESVLLDCDTSKDGCSGQMPLQLADRKVQARIAAIYGYPDLIVRIKAGPVAFRASENGLQDIHAPLKGESPTYRLYALPENWANDGLVVRRGEPVPGYLTVSVERK